MWIDEPIWPFSETFNRPIAFLGQIELKPEIFGDIIDHHVRLIGGHEEDIPEEMPWEEQGDHYAGVKIGGVPLLWDEYFTPTGGLKAWNLLLQIDAKSQSDVVPLHVDFGDGGCGWFFCPETGRPSSSPGPPIDPKSPTAFYDPRMLLAAVV